MKQINTRTGLIIILLSAVGSAHCIAEEALLSVNSNTPDIDVRLRSSDRSLIRLPRLNYAFQIDARCPTGQSPRSMFISIADTRKRLSATELRESAEAGITISIPAKQIAPLTVESFCVEEDGSSRQQHEPITVRGALSAQAALLCSDDSDEKMVYASRSLDITLNCIDERPEKGGSEFTAAEH